MLQTPADKPFHRPIDRLPTGLKYLRRLSPGKPPAPQGQKPHHRRGHRPLAMTPGNMLHHYPMRRALHPPRRIPKPRHNPPHRHEQPPPLGQVVITWGRPPALRACAPPTLVRLHGDLKAKFTSGAAQPNVAVNEPNEMLNPVQKCLNFQLHCWPLVSFLRRSQHRSETKVSLFFSTINPGHSRRLFGRAVSGGNERSNSSSRSRRSPRVTDSPARQNRRGNQRPIT
jgi:hypothetical protein